MPTAVLTAILTTVFTAVLTAVLIATMSLKKSQRSKKMKFNDPPPLHDRIEWLENSESVQTIVREFMENVQVWDMVFHDSGKSKKNPSSKLKLHWCEVVSQCVFGSLKDIIWTQHSHSVKHRNPVSN